MPNKPPEIPNLGQRGKPGEEPRFDIVRNQSERSKLLERQETNPSGDGHRDLICKVDKELAAKDSLQKAFGSRKTALGINHPKTIESLYSLVEVHERLKDFQGIKNLLNENDENALLNDAPATGKTADILHCLGKAYLEQRDLYRAEEIFQSELYVRATADGIGPNHPTVAKPFDSLSSIHKIEEESKLQERKFQEALQANKMEESCLRSALDVLPAVRQNLDLSKRSKSQRTQGINSSDNEDRGYLEKRLEECLKMGTEIKNEIKWKDYLHKSATYSKPDLKSLDLEGLPDATDTSKSELMRSPSDLGKFVHGRIIGKPKEPEQPEQVAPSEMARPTSKDGKRGFRRFVSRLMGSKRERRSLPSWEENIVSNDTASSSHVALKATHKMQAMHKMISRILVGWKYR
jgi:tetratricopeptide (TPR) repeat protein